MVYSVPGGQNTFVPSHEATNGLIADFSRNPDEFALANYMQYVPVQKTKGYFLEMNLEMAARVLNPDLADIAWPDGNDAPSQQGNLEEFSFRPFMCQRIAPGFRLGELANDNADWDINAAEMRHAAQRCMTARTTKAVTAMTNEASYLADHIIDVDAPPADLPIGGKLDAATSADMDLKRTMDYAYTKLHKSTLGSVKQDQVQFVMNPITAQRLANCNEIRDTIKQSPIGMNLITKQLGPNQHFGLPVDLYGYGLVVEDAVRVSTVKGAATPSKEYILPDGVLAIVSRVGGLEGVENAPSFSTFQIFLYTEMQVESKHDTDNKLYTGRVIDNFDVRMVSRLSAAYIKNAIT